MARLAQPRRRKPIARRCATLLPQCRSRYSLAGVCAAWLMWKTAFDAGASRVVIGTAATETPELVAEVLQRHGPARLTIGLDSKDGMIVTRGWQQATPLTAIGVGEH